MENQSAKFNSEQMRNDRKKPSKPIVRAGGSADFQERIFRCNINVTDICNQKCSYCINADTHNNQRRVLDSSVLSQFIEDIVPRITDKSYFTVAGGEPFIYPHLKFLIEKIASTIPGSYTQVRFLTNGSLMPRAAYPLYNIKKHIDLKYVVSIHMDFMNLDKFISNISAFPYKEDVLCKILMAPGQLENAKAHLDKLKNAGLKTYVNAATGLPDPFTAEEMAFLHSHPNVFFPIDITYLYEDGTTASKSDPDMVFKKSDFNFQGMYCGAGMTSMRLAPDGTVIPCFGIHAIPKNKRVVFNISKTRLRDIPDFDKAWKCPSTYCFCAPFLSAPKWRESSAKPDWLEAELPNI